MLSARSSFTATNWPDKILAASFADIGGRAVESTTTLLYLPAATPAAGAHITAIGRAGIVTRECDALAISLTRGPPWLMVGKLAIAVAAGSTPRVPIGELPLKGGMGGALVCTEGSTHY